MTDMTVFLMKGILSIRVDDYRARKRSIPGLQKGQQKMSMGSEVCYGSRQRRKDRNQYSEGLPKVRKGRLFPDVTRRRMAMLFLWSAADCDTDADASRQWSIKFRFHGGRELYECRQKQSKKLGSGLRIWLRRWEIRWEIKKYQNKNRAQITV